MHSLTLIDTVPPSMMNCGQRDRGKTVGDPATAGITGEPFFVSRGRSDPRIEVVLCGMSRL